MKLKRYKNGGIGMKLEPRDFIKVGLNRTLNMYKLYEEYFRPMDLHLKYINSYTFLIDTKSGDVYDFGLPMGITIKSLKDLLLEKYKINHSVRLKPMTDIEIINKMLTVALELPS